MSYLQHEQAVQQILCDHYHKNLCACDEWPQRCEQYPRGYDTLFSITITEVLATLDHVHQLNTVETFITPSQRDNNTLWEYTDPTGDSVRIRVRPHNQRDGQDEQDATVSLLLTAMTHERDFGVGVFLSETAIIDLHNWIADVLRQRRQATATTTNNGDDEQR